MTVIADDSYIRNSIHNPASQIVDGYQPIMPTFKGQLTDEKLNGLVAYIKSLSGVTGTGSASTPAGASTANTASNSATAAPPANSTPLRADRGNSTSQGSNPNAPGATNSNR